MKKKDNYIFNLFFAEILNRGRYVRFKLHGSSMHPVLQEGDFLTAKPVKPQDVKIGDILAYQDIRTKRIIVHRLVKKIRRSGVLLTMADAAPGGLYDLPLGADTHIIARVVALERGKEKINLSTLPAKFYGLIKTLILLAYHAAVVMYRKLFKRVSKTPRILRDISLS